MGSKMKMTGVNEMKARLREAATNAHAQIVDAVKTEAERMLAESQERVPVDTGALRDSGKVTMVDDGKTVKGIVSYGNEQVDYAVEVHENLEVQHPHGEAKVLESVIDENAPTLAAELAERIDIGKA